MSTYDPTDRPIPGTACEVCRDVDQYGHFCPARGYLGEIAVCEPCGTGSLCEHIQALDRLHSTAEHMETEAGFIPDPGRTIEVTPELRAANTFAAPLAPAQRKPYEFQLGPRSGRTGRQKIMRRCEWCNVELGSKELAAHKSECPKKPASCRRGIRKQVPSAAPVAPSPEREPERLTHRQEKDHPLPLSETTSAPSPLKVGDFRLIDRSALPPNKNTGRIEVMFKTLIDAPPDKALTILCETTKKAGNTLAQLKAKAKAQKLTIKGYVEGNSAYAWREVPAVQA